LPANSVLRGRLIKIQTKVLDSGMSSLFNQEINGFLVIDKPQGVTSHDVVQTVRCHLKIRRVGHLGTLDPLATGVLPLAVGKATRLARFTPGGLKVYQGTIRLGFSTDTFDGEGQATSEPVVPQVSLEQIQEISDHLLGEQLQIPPPFSAKKIAGVRSYKLARRGVEVSLPPQQICIRQFNLVPRGGSELDFEIHCSAGTYVRSVAHEVGRGLGCGAHLTRLRRTASGEFKLDRALSLPALLTLSPSDLCRHLISMNDALSAFPEVILDSKLQTQFAHGTDFIATAKVSNLSVKPLFRMVSLQGELLGLAEPVAERCVDAEPDTLIAFHPKVVL
jgi:tRNA pseudouridine55 synthase